MIEIVQWLVQIAVIGALAFGTTIWFDRAMRVRIGGESYRSVLGPIMVFMLATYVVGFWMGMVIW